MTIIITACILLCILAAAFLVMRYNLHMLQLNGYHGREHLQWLRGNWRRQVVLFLAIPAAAACWFSPRWAAAILAVVLLGVIIQYYQYLRASQVKKKLAYTARAARIMATDAFFCAIAGVAAFLLLEPGGALCALAAILFLQPLAVPLANFLNIPIERGVRRHYINDAKRILGENEGLIVIGVTGSYGKTSVKFYLETLLREKYNVLATPESYNTPMGIVKTIRGSLNKMHEVFICEMGARNVGEIREICDIVHPAHGIITAVGEQHLKTFGSIDNVLKTKFELADALPEGGMLFLNADNELIRKKAPEYGHPIMYSAAGRGDYVADNISLSKTGTSFSVTSPRGERCDFHTSLVGEHNIINILGAIAVACEMGIELERLRGAVRKIQPVPHRMQLIERGAVTIIDDAFNSNPAGSRAAVETLKMFSGVRILITPGMVELGEREDELNRLFGTYAASCCDYIYLVGDSHVDPIRDGAIGAGFDGDRLEKCGSLKDAMDQALSIRAEGRKYILLENDLPDNY